ncbi:MAG TPA: alpha-amylase family glycosyl hydrolase [Anaerolineae bacterium]|nr:alpha-amylase family glycosyl hydrolase [Anaerolineae bacterium]
MNELVFGTLATPELRLAYARQRQQGVSHHNQRQPWVPEPGERPMLKVTIEEKVAIEKVVCHITEPEKRTVLLDRVDTNWDLFNWTYYQTWQGQLPAYDEGRVVRYHILAHPADGSPPIPADNGQNFSYLVREISPPDWSYEAVIYQVFPDRFAVGHDQQWRDTDDLTAIHGGTLAGIIEKLDYIADLGFNCIWLNPFFPDTTHHGYHATDYFAVNPRLGNMDDLRRLLNEAHGRGIRIILDFVANHWGSGHFSFQHARQHEDSPYHNWYHWDQWPDEYETFFGVKDLPTINVDHPEARAYLLKAAHFWLTEFDFDGYRLDYAYGPSHDFWADFFATVKVANPDAWVFGEVVETPNKQLSYLGYFDGCLDFMLLQIMRHTFAQRRRTLVEFDSFLTQHERFFPPNFSQPCFLDNHDMNRFIWLADGDSRILKVAATCQFTLPGQPIVYYGTEVGISQDLSIQPPDNGGMEQARKRMVWSEEGQDRELHAFYKRLIAFRRDNPVLVYGQRCTLYVSDETKTYVYSRYDETTRLIIFLSLSDKEEKVLIADQLFTLPPYAALIWNQDNNCLYNIANGDITETT